MFLLSCHNFSKRQIFTLDAGGCDGYGDAYSITPLCHNIKAAEGSEMSPNSENRMLKFEQE